ncbi:DMT family transporter [Chachezhania antarctica]|uniref:DMT family transporter n=1 Tax=Chachezhania antarctica TaxID=2340860 RepID=UPI000EAD5C29|nr:DMT family transporter [Chachezhania antarctica]
MTNTSATPISAGMAGVAFLLGGTVMISINDMLMKALSGDYPLHQLVLIRSLIGVCFSLAIVQAEGGWSVLRTRRPWLHLLRGALIVSANMTYFLALAVLPLADATALFFVAPLLITLLSIPVLGETVGPWRIGAVLVGLAGVILMQRPWASSEVLGASRLVMLLPVFAAFAYALMQIITRKIGAESKASAMAVYIQAIFIVVSLGFGLVAGDGRFVDENSGASLQFLLRAWVWPPSHDWLTLLGLGFCSAIIGYALSQAYRLSDAATVAPFEYAALPLAVFWGWYIWGDLPVIEVWLGMALIAGSGLVVFLRERIRTRRPARGPAKGRY